MSSSSKKRNRKDDEPTFTEVQRQVLSVFQLNKSDEGASIDDVIEQLPEHKAKKIKQTISSLSDEGHLYSTVDDNHFKLVTELVLTKPESDKQEEEEKQESETPEKPKEDAESTTVNPSDSTPTAPSSSSTPCTTVSASGYSPNYDPNKDLIKLSAYCTANMWRYQAKNKEGELEWKNQAEGNIKLDIQLAQGEDTKRCTHYIGINNVTAGRQAFDGYSYPNFCMMTPFAVSAYHSLPPYGSLGKPGEERTFTSKKKTEEGGKDKPEAGKGIPTISFLLTDRPYSTRKDGDGRDAGMSDFFGKQGALYELWKTVAKLILLNPTHFNEYIKDIIEQQAEAKEIDKKKVTDEMITIAIANQLLRAMIGTRKAPFDNERFIAPRRRMAANCTRPKRGSNEPPEKKRPDKEWLATTDPRIQKIMLDKDAEGYFFIKRYDFPTFYQLTSPAEFKKDPKSKPFTRVGPLEFAKTCSDGDIFTSIIGISLEQAREKGKVVLTPVVRLERVFRLSGEHAFEPDYKPPENFAFGCDDSVEAYKGGKQILWDCQTDSDCNDPGQQAKCVHNPVISRKQCSCVADSDCPYTMKCGQYSLSFFGGNSFPTFGYCYCNPNEYGTAAGCPAHWRCGWDRIAQTTLPDPALPYVAQDFTPALVGLYGDSVFDTIASGCVCDYYGVSDESVPCGGLGHGTCQALSTEGNFVGSLCRCNNYIPDPIQGEMWSGGDCTTDLCPGLWCNGHGQCICPPDGPGPAVISVNTGSGIGTQCIYSPGNLISNRGQYSCLCNEGYLPDHGVSGEPHCNAFAQCGVNGIAEGPNGACQCINDYYLLFDSASLTSYCVPGCAANRCSGHGVCTTQSGAGNSTTNYNADCSCEFGWRTDPGRTLSTFSTNVYCSVPFLIANGFNHYDCGLYGYYDTYSQQCICSTNNAPQITQDPVSGLCVNQCLVYSGNGQLCGGPTRGKCENDAYAGHICNCNNGYYGFACESNKCPIVNNAPCSSNGVCDMSTGYCICNSGYVGLDCQIRDVDCDASQVVKSYP